MERVLRHGQMELSIMEIGATVKLMVKVSFCMRMVMFLKAILNKTKLMGMVFTHIKMDRDTRVTG